MVQLALSYDEKLAGAAEEVGDSDEGVDGVIDGWRVLNVFSLKSIEQEAEMIHLAVPSTQNLVDKDGVTKYTAYNLHVNGWFHAAVRFSHLHQLSESIRQRFGTKYRGPLFPPKKLFTLNERQIEERREKIGKYFNALVQYSDIIRHHSVEKWFLDVQSLSFRATSIHVTVDVYLGDGERVTIKSKVNDSTNEIMKLLADQLKISEDLLMWNFGLFMVRPLDRNAFDVLPVRLLRNFEAPYISLQTVNQKSAAQGIYHKIMLRKLIWDPRVEEQLLETPEIASLLVKQAQTEYACGRFKLLRPEVADRLRQYERNGDHIQYLRTCHKQPTYSYEVLEECVGDFPKAGTRCLVKIGRRQIVLAYGEKFEEEKIFQATRIRVWRISEPREVHGPLVFQFEYLIGNDSFEWFTLYTNQAILLSLLFQSVGNEILHEHRNMSISQQLMLNGGGSGMSLFLEPPKRSTPSLTTASTSSTGKDSNQNSEVPSLSARSTCSEESEPPRRSSIQSATSLKSAKSAITTIEDCNSFAGGRGGIADLADFQDVFTTISDVLPLYNEAFANITDDDL